MGFEMGSHVGAASRAEEGMSRGKSPEWKNLWSAISSIEGRLWGLWWRREVIRSFASVEMGFVSGKSYWFSLIFLPSVPPFGALVLVDDFYVFGLEGWFSN
jgi:hypothetical protein